MAAAVSSLTQLTSFSWLILSWALTVIAEGAVPFYNLRFDPAFQSIADELPPLGRVAHGAVEDGTEDLRALQVHIIIGLIDDKFHRDELSQMILYFL